MYGNKKWFFDLDETFRQSMKLGDNLRMMIMGQGTIKLHINDLTHLITELHCTWIKKQSFKHRSTSRKEPGYSHPELDE